VVMSCTCSCTPWTCLSWPRLTGRSPAAVCWRACHSYTSSSSVSSATAPTSTRHP
jgi:hypothetical protein